MHSTFHFENIALQYPEGEKVILQRLAALKAGAHPSLRNDKRKSLKRHKAVELRCP